jgi:hypothetical protein
MATKKKTAPRRKNTPLGPDASPTIQFLVVTFTLLSIVYVAMAYWRYG